MDAKLTKNCVDKYISYLLIYFEEYCHCTHPHVQENVVKQPSFTTTKKKEDHLHMPTVKQPPHIYIINESKAILNKGMHFLSFSFYYRLVKTLKLNWHFI